MASNRRFGVTSNLQGLSHGIVVNNISSNNSCDSAEARDHKGNIIDIAVYGENKQVTIDGLYTGQGVEAGTVIRLDGENYIVTSTGRNETNTAFQTASVNARYYPGQFPLDPNPSLSFRAINGPASIQLNQLGSPDPISLSYRKNNNTWITYNVGDIIDLKKGDVVFLSGANDHFSKGNSVHFYYFTIAGDVNASGNIQSLMNFSDSCLGLCYANLFRNCSSLKIAPQLPATTLCGGCYYQMFYGCTNLISAPALPATQIAPWCYRDMFCNCSSLTSAPSALPATSLAPYCYYQMFLGCSKLNKSPSLPATSLASSCYEDMFYGCTSLTSAPSALPATFLAPRCYRQMFYGCQSLTIAPDLPATSLATRCYDNMFAECYSLTVAPTLPATTLADGCYRSMFAECQSLITAPDLPATSLASSCYLGMFSWCTSLSSINVNFTSWQGDDSTLSWLQNVASTGIFYKPSGLAEEYGDNRIPTSWTVYNHEQNNPLTFKAVNGAGNIVLKKIGSPTAIVLDYKINDGAWTSYNIGDIISLNEGDTVALSGPNNSFSYKDTMYYSDNRYYFEMTGTIESSGNIQSLMNYSDSTNNYCYFKLFQNCTSLRTAPQLSATTLYEGCYKTMFGGCTSLTAAPKLPATTLVKSCYSSMFNGCTSLTDAPQLPATTLATDCYNYMFYGCSNLSSINVNFTSWYEGSLNPFQPLNNWVNGVAQNGVFTKPSNLPNEFGDSKIPTDWNIINK